MLGFSVKGSNNTLRTALLKSANATVGNIVDSANAVGAGVIQAGKALPTAAGAVSSIGCGVIQNPAIRQGASFVSTVPSPFAQGAAKSVMTSTGVCATYSPPASSMMPIQSAGWSPHAAAMAMPTKAGAIQRLPAGSIQWQKRKTGRWVYAAPKTKSLSGALGWAAVTSLGAPGFVTPWTKPSAFTSPTAIVPGMFRKSLWRRQYNWYDVNTADSPYRTTWGIGESHTIVGEGPLPSPDAETVSEAEGKRATTPWYKKWWFWTAVGVSTVAGGTYLFYTRR